MFNVSFIGNCGKDPNVKYSEKGTAITWLSVAVHVGHGEEKTTKWVTVKAMYKLGEAVGNNLSKGRRILVSGSLMIAKNKETGEDFEYIRAKEIEYLDKKKVSG